MIYLAHSKNRVGDEEPLRTHLTRVAQRAAAYAKAFGAEEEAALLGWLHDLGKYSPRFLERLQGRERGLDHWTMGAIVARKKYGRKGIAAAVAILGHHVGMQHAGKLVEEFKELLGNPPTNLTENDPEILLRRFTEDGLVLSDSLQASVYDSDPGKPGLTGMLDIRMLFSTLVDADFIETEAHFEARSPGTRQYRPIMDLPLHAESAIELLRNRVVEIAQTVEASERLKALRADLLSTCLQKGAEPPGVFTLSAPTGAGKTLAMLAFALEHARQHGLRRIVVVIPYLSIIEQTVRIYRELLSPHFGQFYVLEDHSLAGVRKRHDENDERLEDHVDGATRTARLLAENWDAPLVVTTSVQCLESLFANRPGACRKLHRLAKSVILFDEVQTLPPSLAVPTLATLSRLCERYSSTVVFSTATQPAFDHLHQDIRKHCLTGWQPREIASAGLKLFDRARRVRIEWRLREDQRVTWEQLADELALKENEQVLCIVNLKRHAKALAELLRARNVAGLFHLSTNMCPAHRKGVLDEVRAQLNSKQPCRLISTQCVEAGVDVDFPRAYRALAPLDAIAQAAGRCNRGDNLDAPGVVIVFVPHDEGYPPGWYKQATGATRTYLNSLNVDAASLDQLDLIHDVKHLKAFYCTLYDLSNVGAMENRAGRDLRDAFLRRDFRDVAANYRLIDQDTISVLVPYERKQFDRLLSAIEQVGRLTREWVQDAREHAVNLFRPRMEDQSGMWNCLDPVPVAPNREPDHLTADWFILTGPDIYKLYDTELLGLEALTDQWIA